MKKASDKKYKLGRERPSGDADSWQKRDVRTGQYREHKSSMTSAGQSLEYGPVSSRSATAADLRRAALKARVRAAHDAITDEEDAEITAAAKADSDTVDPDKALKRIGRPPAAVTKEKVMLRLDPDILVAFRASGAGWQTRMNDALRKAAGLEPKG